jgi:flagellar motor protein MotB
VDIDDGTPIVRYMKLETFLLLLAGQVFIPSHELLTSLDPLESKLVFELPDRWRFWEDHANEISNRFTSSEVAPLASRGQGGTGMFARLTVRSSDGTVIHAPRDAKAVFRICLSELSRERCVWCWNRFQSHSHALWQLYGNRGVAVHSTVGAVKKALLDAGVRRGIVAPVSYVNAEDQNVDKVFSNWENVFFPHLLKSVSFEYEKEIRFILRAHYEVIKVQKGVMVEIDASSIIFPDAKVTVSPQLQREEQEIIKRLIERRRDGPKEEPLKLNEDWSRLYAAHKDPPKEAPFPTEDQTPNPFRDLD